MKTKISLNRFTWGLSALLALSGAYAYLTRFTGFTGAPNNEKLLLLGLSLLISSIFSLLLSGLLVKKWFIRLPGKIVGSFFAGAAMISAVCMSFVFSPPPFPENHTLEMLILEENNPYSIQHPVTVISVERVYHPGGEKISVAPEELDISPEWQGLADNNLYWEAGNQGVIKFKSFMQAGLELVFKSGPGQGVIQITWDGEEQIIDLSNFEPPTHTLDLYPAYNFAAADPLRRFIVVLAFITEWILFSFSLAIFGLILYSALRGKLFVRHQQLFAFGFLVLLILYLPVMLLVKPVHFEDRNLEKVVREILNNPDQPITNYQLKTVASIDASNRSIDNLEGIQYLHNLHELNLRGNNIQDLNPLSGLKYLEKLDLRENRISDLAPLAHLTSLVYLNLHSNPEIDSIKPLAGFTRLETLILAGIQVGEETEIFSSFPNLVHLNLRDCGISDISSLAEMDKLYYLNLHSNPGIVSIQPLAGKTHLNTLILEGVPVQGQVSLLGEFIKLGYLNLSDTGLTDISPLSGLKELQYLNLQSNPGIASIAPISGLTRLQTLLLRDVQVANQVSILHNFPNLAQLDMRNTGLTDTSVLGQLMSKGALQDKASQALLAAVDIRDNPLDSMPADSFNPLRTYWNNISLRVPFYLPEAQSLEPPAFSYTAGFYQQGFYLKLSSNQPHTSIYYTLDGSEPTRQSSLYLNPIQISSRQDDPNGISSIFVTPFSQEPDGEVFKATVVRAKIFDDQNGGQSPTITHTYFVDEAITERYSLPVISLVTDNENLFDYRTGIYVMGQIYDLNHMPGDGFSWKQPANYNQRGMEWERPVHIELFEEQGTPGFSWEGSIRINGGGTRSFPQKSLRIYARDRYDSEESFTYDLFPGLANKINGLPLNQFSSFVLRNSGNDWDKTMMRDVLMQSLVSSTSLDSMAYRPLIVFINGEFWGLYNMRQRMDENYLAGVYQVDPEQVVMIDDYALYRGEPGDEVLYKSFVKHIKGHDLEDPTAYQSVQTMMDTKNFIEYLVSQIYFGNEDWPHRNVRLWRTKTASASSTALPGQDGRWRWMLFDTDYSFGLNYLFRAYTINTIDLGEYPNDTRSLYYALLENDAFKEQFINTFADHLNTSFSEGRVLDRIEEIRVVMRSEMEEHIRRWRTMGDSYETWKLNVEKLREFARNRPYYVRQQIVDFFGLQGTAVLTLQTDQEKGFIQVNSIAITSDTPGVVDPSNWTGEYFIGVPIRVTAVPHSGYQFAGWEGLEKENARAEITLTLKEDLVLKANFIAVQ